MIVTLSDDIQTVVERVMASEEMATVRQYLIDNQSQTVEHTAFLPAFFAGSPKEINQRLVDMGKDPINMYRRYPCIVMKTSPEPTLGGGLFHYNLNIAILHYSDSKYTYKQRRELVFKPILYPIYIEFIKQLRFARLFTWPGGKIPEHTPIERPFYAYGSDNGGDRNIFSDAVDAIEIRGLKINKKIPCGRKFDRTFDRIFN
jgi:hypothetical protein